MTYEEEKEVRRTSVRAKVLAFGFAILAVLGSFWGIVWFIRAYVEAPRVNTPAPIALASQGSVPAPPPADPRPALASPPSPAVPDRAQQEAPTPPAARTAAVQEESLRLPVTRLIEDRWLPTASMTMLQPPPQAVPPAAPPAEASPQARPLESPASPPGNSIPAALATGPADTKAADDEVAEATEPTIPPPAPLPRRKPTVAATKRAAAEPPLPRPRPDGPAPQSVWTSVPTSDDRYPQQ